MNVTFVSPSALARWLLAPRKGFKTPLEFTLTLGVIVVPLGLIFVWPSVTFARAVPWLLRELWLWLLVALEQR